MCAAHTMEACLGSARESNDADPSDPNVSLGHHQGCRQITEFTDSAIRDGWICQVVSGVLCEPRHFPLPNQKEASYREKDLAKPIAPK